MDLQSLAMTLEASLDPIQNKQGLSTPLSLFLDLRLMLRSRDCPPPGTKEAWVHFTAIKDRRLRYLWLNSASGQCSLFQKLHPTQLDRTSYETSAEAQQRFAEMVIG